MSASSSVSYAPARPGAETGGRGLVDRLVHTRASAAPMVARVVLGAVIFPHAAQKAFGWFGGRGWSATIEGFNQGLGMPVFIAALAILMELLGAIGLILGVLSRLSALAVAGVMLGAIFLVHLPHGFFMNWRGNQAGQGFEFHLLAFGLAVVVMIAGGGLWSADRAIAKKT